MKTKRIYYYWWQHPGSHAYYYATYERKADALQDNRATKREGRWAGPVRSLGITVDRPA